MKQKNLLKPLVGLLFSLCLLISCSDSDDKIENPPKIIIDQVDNTFTTKIGKSITIQPTYENVSGAIYAWKLNGEVIGNESNITFTSNEVESVFIILDVITNSGIASSEIKINVASLLIPTATINIPDNGYKIIKDGTLSLLPIVETYDLESTYQWTVNGEKVSNEKEYKFTSKDKGTYNIKFVVENEDGKASLDFPIEVCNADELPYQWTFDQTIFNLATGRSIKINIWDIKNEFDAKYTWSINGEVKQEGNETSFIFTEKTIGKYKVLVTMSNSYSTLSKELEVNVCAPEGTYKKIGGTKIEVNKVYEYLPAPGQFINENYIANTMEEAIAYAQDRLALNQYACLGGFGGYIVAGFDHSVDNDGSYNLEIIGNSFAGSSEPGIVWVMQDENGNGLPDDTWYELKGSEFTNPATTYNYAVTYYKPKSPGMPVQWTDSKGKSGSVDYLGSFHTQDYYYPAWVTTDTYTLRGTCLESRTKETSPGYWYNGEFEWGYADNFSPIDRLTDDINYNAAPNGNHMKISDAITFDGKPANLKYIDFVKIQTGVNAKAGWLGENSTEVFGIKDFNLFK